MNELAKRLELTDIITGFDSLFQRSETLDEMRHLLSEACRYNGFFRSGREVFKPVLGKVLLAIRDNHTWEQLGYQTFGQFLEAEVAQKLNTPRTEAYDAMRLVEKWPSLGPSDCAELGTVKLRALSKASDETHVTANAWLQRARSMSSEEFEQIVDSHIGTDGKDEKLVTIKMLVSKRVRDQWEEFCETVGMNHCETSQGGTVFESLMMELHSNGVAKWPK